MICPRLLQMRKTETKNLLFVHQNFPGQFRHLAAACANAGHRVVALGYNKTPELAGIETVRYRLPPSIAPQSPPWLADFETKCLRARAALAAARQLQQQGFKPDVIVAHAGWGEAMFLKQVWPGARLGLYAEFFYRAEGADVGFDPEFRAQDPSLQPRLLLKNTANHLQFAQAEASLSPTHWQASTYPEEWRSRMSVIHEGVDTDRLQPLPPSQSTADMVLSDGQKIPGSAEVITFVARNLEPYRGYHVFMRALPELLALRPDAHVLVVGGDGTSYGSKPSDGISWKARFWSEVKASIAPNRVHFLGQLSYKQYLAVMHRADVHVYLTYPFVLSWSLIEAMSLGKAIVASATAPVEEVIDDGEQGLLVPFFDTSALARTTAHLLHNPALRQRLGQSAREKAVRQYDLHRFCLPRQQAWIDQLAHLPLRPQ